MSIDPQKHIQFEKKVIVESSYLRPLLKTLKTWPWFFTGNANQQVFVESTRRYQGEATC